jgi:hypothetical protein
MTRSEWVKEGWKTRRINNGANGGVMGPPKIQFCPYGHDTIINGRSRGGGCHICHLGAQKKWRLAHKAQIMAINVRSNLKCKYGMTENDYNRMFQIQGGKCAICEAHQTDLKSKLCVDHNHTTGKVRGLLCAGCNTSLGHYETKKNLCEKYLGKYI